MDNYPLDNFPLKDFGDGGQPNQGCRPDEPGSRPYHGGTPLGTFARPDYSVMEALELYHARQAGIEPEIEVTPEMARAGYEAWLFYDKGSPPDVRWIYKAMEAARRKSWEPK